MVFRGSVSNFKIAYLDPQTGKTDHTMYLNAEGIGFAKGQRATGAGSRQREPLPSAREPALGKVRSPR